jgi:flotillin
MQLDGFNIQTISDNGYLDALGRRRIAEANQERDLRLAAIATEVDAAKTRAGQAVPLAEAEGIRAVMTAEADGQAKRADALNQLSDQAGRQNVLPRLIQVLRNWPT